MMMNYDNLMGKLFDFNLIFIYAEISLDKMICGRIQLHRKLVFWMNGLRESQIYDRAVPSGTIPSRPQSSYLDRDGALSSRPVTESPKQIPQTIASFEPKRTSARTRRFPFVFTGCYFVFNA